MNPISFSTHRERGKSRCCSYPMMLSMVDPVESLENLRSKKKEAGSLFKKKQISTFLQLAYCAISTCSQAERGKLIKVPSFLSDDDYYLESTILTGTHFTDTRRNLRFLALRGLKIMGFLEFAKLRWLSWQICPPAFKSVTLKLEK